MAATLGQAGLTVAAVHSDSSGTDSGGAVADSCSLRNGLFQPTEVFVCFLFFFWGGGPCGMRGVGGWDGMGWDGMGCGGGMGV